MPRWAAAARVPLLRALEPVSRDTEFKGWPPPAAFVVVSIYDPWDLWHHGLPAGLATCAYRGSYRRRAGAPVRCLGDLRCGLPHTSVHTVDSSHSAPLRASCCPGESPGAVVEPGHLGYLVSGCIRTSPLGFRWHLSWLASLCIFEMSPKPSKRNKLLKKSEDEKGDQDATVTREWMIPVY